MNAWISPSFCGCRSIAGGWGDRDRHRSVRPANSRTRGSTPPRSCAEIIEHDRPGTALGTWPDHRGGNPPGGGISHAVLGARSSPRMRAEPAVGLIRSNSSRIVVDLPAPLGQEAEHLALLNLQSSLERPASRQPVVLRHARASRSRAGALTAGLSTARGAQARAAAERAIVIPSSQTARYSTPRPGRRSAHP